MLADMARLPDEQRAALVLAELGDLSQDQIGEVLGVRRERVKSLVYQARHTLIAERAARSESCADIRAELSVAHGPQLRRGRLKRHLRACDGCRAFHREVGTQHAAFAVLLPVVAGEALHGKVLGTALAAAKGATAVGGAAAGASALASAGTGAGAGAGLSAAGSGVTVAKSELRSVDFLRAIMLPADYRSRLSARELDDIVSYLMTIGRANTLRNSNKPPRNEE